MSRDTGPFPTAAEPVADPAGSAPPSAEDVARALSALTSLLTESAGVVKAGGMVDLVGLDREVQQTLEAVVSLPPPEARALLPSLDELLKLLDTLSGDLQTVHGAALPQQETVEARRRATAAYRNAEEA